MRHPHEVKLAMEQVARRRGMTVNAMLGKSHEPQFVDARRELARILRARHLSWNQIARYMGKDPGLALACDLDRTYVGGVERGQRNISLVNIHKIDRKSVV